MNITKDYLKAERGKLIAQHEKLVGGANAVSGAINMIDALLARIDKPEPADAPAPETPATST